MFQKDSTLNDHVHYSYLFANKYWLIANTWHTFIMLHLGFLVCTIFIKNEHLFFWRSIEEKFLVQCKYFLHSFAEKKFIFNEYITNYESQVKYNKSLSSISYEPHLLANKYVLCTHSKVNKFKMMCYIEYEMVNLLSPVN